jgi:hypothetical protein
MKNDDDIQAALAGQLLSSWLPIGVIRKLIFLTLLIFAVIGIATEPQWYHFLSILIALIFSPRVVGEITYALGKIIAMFSNKT